MRHLELRCPPVLQAALAAALMWWLHRQFAGTPLPAQGLAVTLALVCAAAGAAVALNGVWQFSQRRTTVDPRTPGRSSSLVNTGIYRFSRNPMYLGMLLMLAGWALYLGSCTPWLVLPAFVLSMNRLQIIPEERHLAALFGTAYQEYCSRVRRWL